MIAALFAGALALAALKGTLGVALAPILRAAVTILVAAALIVAIGRLPTLGAVAAAGLLMTADLSFNNGPNEFDGFTGGNL